VIVAVYSVVHGQCAWLWGDIAVHYFSMLFIILLNERISDIITRYLWIISLCLHGIHVGEHVQREREERYKLIWCSWTYILSDLQDFVISIPNCRDMGPQIVVLTYFS